jgi:predicted transcriptional regulator
MQGQSARQEVRLFILRSLLEKNQLGFEELVNILQKIASRGTVNKYLNELYDEGFVNRKGRRGKYFLTSSGKKEIRQLGEEKLRRNIEATKKSSDEYIKNIVQLSQEGHAKILTKDEIKKINFPLPKKLPIEVDKKGANQLGISDSQFFFIKGLQQAVKNLEKQGIKGGIIVKGEGKIFGIGTEKKMKKKGKKTEN